MVMHAWRAGRQCGGATIRIDARRWQGLTLHSGAGFGSISMRHHHLTARLIANSFMTVVMLRPLSPSKVHSKQCRLLADSGIRSIALAPFGGHRGTSPTATGCLDTCKGHSKWGAACARGCSRRSPGNTRSQGRPFALLAVWSGGGHQPACRSGVFVSSRPVLRCQLCPSLLVAQVSSA